MARAGEPDWHKRVQSQLPFGRLLDPTEIATRWRNDYCACIRLLHQRCEHRKP